MVRDLFVPADSTAIVPLEQATDPLRCGYKAAALAALAGQGFDIPAGFVIPPDAELAATALAAALERLGHGPVAVRSSGVVEDRPDSAHAGQYDSVLNVQGVEAVIAAAQRVRRSAHARRGGDAGVGPMAVLVQMMIEADAAGVAFSANPLTGDRDEIVINATRGLGDRLLAGEVNAEAWAVRRGEARCTSGAATVLGAAMARRVAALAERVERARGGPQDIEWAIRGERLALLQARPITVLPVPPAIDIPKGS
jgi:pyruvate,water dikinase